MMRYTVYDPTGDLVVCGRAVLAAGVNPRGEYHWEFWLEPTGLKVPNVPDARYRACMFKSIREADEAALALRLPDHRVRTLNL